MKFNKIEYLISERPETPEILTIEANGTARYESYSNEMRPDNPEIGIYQTTLPEADIQSLEDLITSPLIESIPDHWGQVKSGELSRRIRVLSDAETIEKLVCSRLPVDPDMHKIIQSLNQIITMLKANPLQTIRIGLSDALVTPDKIFTVVLSITNTGVEPANHRNPLEMIGKSDCQILIQGWPDKPPSEFNSMDMITLKPTIIEPLEPSEIPEEMEEFIEVAPANTISFRISSETDLEDGGAYLIRVIYTNNSNVIEERKIITGEVYSETVKVIFP